MDVNIIEQRKLEAKILGQNLVLSTAKTSPTSDFRDSFIQYLKENSRGRILLKLMKCNKWFIPKNFKLNDSNNVSSYTWNIGYMEKFGMDDSFFRKSLCCELTNIRIFNTTLKYNDLKHLIFGGNIKSILLSNVMVLDNNNGKAAVLIDDIIDLTPKLRGFYLEGQIFQCIPAQIVHKLLQTNLNNIRFFDIPESFDFQTFVDVIKEKPGMIIELRFHDSVSDEHVARIKSGCPFDYISHWYGYRNSTEEEKAEYRMLMKHE